MGGRLRRAAWWLALLALSFALAAGVVTAAERNGSRAQARQRLDRAALALVDILEQWARDLRVTATLLATDPGVAAGEPDALAARWPDLTLDLAILRGADGDRVFGGAGLDPSTVPGAVHPATIPVGDAVWLVITEPVPARSERVTVGRRIDLASLEARVGARIAADPARPDGELSAAVRDPFGGRWTVAVDPTPVGNGPLLVLWIGAFALVIGVAGATFAPEAPAPVLPRLDQASARLARDLAAQSHRAESMQRFLARLSLELRTAVTAIVGYAELVKEEAQRDQRWGPAADVERILVGGRHALDLVDDTLALAQMEQGDLRLEPAAFQVETTLLDVANTLRPLGASLGTRIEVETGDLGAAFTDRARFRHVLRNLIGRGLNATPSGTVAIAAHRESEDWLRIEVTDDGPSLTPAQLDAIFAVAPEHASDRTGPGSSIGLVVARRFARLLGGDIDASANAGRGTRLTLRIPRRLAPSPAPTPLPTGARAG